MVEKKPKTSDESIGNSSKLNAIKELIFGEQIKEYNDQFKMMEKLLKDQKRLFDRKIQLLSEEIAGNIGDLDISIQNKIKQNHTAIKKEIKRLDTEKLNVKKLSELLLKMSEEIEK